MKLLLLFLCFLHSVLTASDYQINFVSCRSNNKTYAIFPACEASDYKIFVTTDFKIPLNNVTVKRNRMRNYLSILIFSKKSQAKFEFYKIENGKSRSMFKTPTIDWCQLMDGGTNTNFIIRMFVTSMKTYTPEFIHSCPYFGMHSIRNSTVIKKLVTVLPNGAFRFKVSMLDQNTEIFYLALEFTIFETI